MSVLEVLVGWLAPPQCVVCDEEGASLCTSCAAVEILPYGERCFSCGSVSSLSRTCERCRSSAPRHVWVATHYENAAKRLVQIYKFGHQRVAVDSLSLLMMTSLLDFNSIGDLQVLDYLIVPVPTATSRVRQRSFDHSALLARQLGHNLKLQYINALARLGQSRQLGSARPRRLTQLDGKFIVRYPRLIAGRNILLVDDVVTTGATLKAATKALRAGGAARVDALVFAKRL